MKRGKVTWLILCLLVGGCGGVRFAPSEQQKQNAWVHNRTAAIAAQQAKQAKTEQADKTEDGKEKDVDAEYEEVNENKKE